MLFGDYIIPQKEELDYLLGFVKFSFFLSEAATASEMIPKSLIYPYLALYLGGL